MPIFLRLRRALTAPLLGLALCFSLGGAGSAQAGVKIEHWEAPSGARVYFVASRALPIIDVQVDVDAGAVLDPEGRSGTAQLVAELLTQGAAGRDENAVAEAQADLGAHLHSGAGMEGATLSLRTLADPATREAALTLLREALTRPDFPDSVFVRERSRSLASLKESLTRPDTLVARAFWSTLYPRHPYGRLTTPESLAAIHRADLLAFYQAHYQARRTTVSIVGDLARAEAEALAARLTADLPRGEPPAALPVPARETGQNVRIAHPAAQAHVRLGLPALQRGDPDFFPLLVGNYSLGGGGFVSRLMKEVRDARGFAYSVYSNLSPMQVAGPFQIGLQTRRAQADEALALSRRLLTEFIAEGPTADELAAAKQNLIGSFPLRLDSNRKLLDNLAVIARYQLPLDYLDRYADNVAAVTAAAVKAAFARHIDPERLSSVVVAAD